MSRTRIKICGITDIKHALVAAKAGADAIGLVFYPPSPRHLELAQAAEIAKAVPPFLTRVALFVDADPEYVKRVIDQVPIDYIQFHGDETPEYCASFGKPWFKALKVRPDTDIQLAIARYPQASAILLDTYHPLLVGGTGEVFDWAQVPATCPIPVILAGGLNSDNVSHAIALTHPYGVDVSGGVESEKGVKSEKKIVEFIGTVNSA